MAVSRVVVEAGRWRRADIGLPRDVADAVVGQVEIDDAIAARVVEPVERVVTELLDDSASEIPPARQVAVRVPIPGQVLDRAAVAGARLAILRLAGERTDAGDRADSRAKGLVDGVAGGVLGIDSPESRGGRVGIADPDERAGVVFVPEPEAGT